MRRARSITLVLFFVAARASGHRQAEAIVERLSSRRRVGGQTGMWSVVYEAADVSEAMRACAAELGDLDPGWIEVLDFVAMRTDRALRIG